MKRTVFAAGLMVALAACQGGDGGPDLEYTVVVNDDAGQPSSPTLSPDGMRLAYSMPVEGRAAIFVANADGSDPSQLTHGVWDDYPSWSPDGGWIAYVAESPDFDVFVVPSNGGEPRQLTSGPASDFAGGWLPDGSAVVVYRTSAGVTQTLAVLLDGGAERPLLPHMEGSQYVTVSPDGSKAAFDLHRGAEGTIWVQDLAGGAPRQLTSEGREDASPTSEMWSPDGRHLAYVSQSTGTGNIWIADVESGDLRQLTSGIHNDWQHTWSPDGRWIAFLSDRSGQTDLWLVAAGGGQAMRVTQDLAVEVNPEWSPDGQTLYYGWSESKTELQVIPVDGGSSRVLVAWPGYGVGAVRVSPDGHTILFGSNRSGNFDIWSVPFEGGEPTPFVASPLDDFLPLFSPDGSQVLFGSNRAGSRDLWVMPAAGGEARQLTDWPSSEAQARWSPDGAMIAFVSDREATTGDLWIVTAAGGEAQRLTTGAGVRSGLDWAPDGRAIYYVGATPTAQSELYRIPVTGGRPSALGADPHIGNGDLSPDGSQYAYSVWEGGWAFIEVIPTTGGAPRRLTTQTERVFQSAVRWSPDGAHMVVSDYDLVNGTDDLLMVTWPEGNWRPLTQTPGISEGLWALTPDGRQMVVTATSSSSRIMSVSVARLVEERG
jgi:Tol biopolymer transport system component